MKNTNRFKMPVQSGPRYRFLLPENEREVKLLAFVQGMMNACIQKEHGYELGKEAIEAGSIEAALLVEKEVKSGKQGCNEPEQFRALFAERCAIIHQAMLNYWEKEPELWRNFQRRPPLQKIANAAHIAEVFYEQVEFRLQNNLPLTFEPIQ